MTTWFFLPQTHRHGIALFHFLSGIISCPCSHKTFPPFCEGRAFQLWTDHNPLVIAISRVSAPLSPRQQRHLAFISEFNVQILYLPNLKMSLLIFCPAQTKQPLDQSPPLRRQIQWISKRWPPSKTVAQKCSVCWAASLKLAFRQTDAQRLAGDIPTGNFRPIVPLKFRKNIFDHFHI